MLEFLKVNNKLKREDLNNITQKFLGVIKESPIFEIPDKNYLDYFEELKQKLNQYELKEDLRFVAYGRLSCLKTELTERLKDEKLKEPDPNWKYKWDNRMGAFWDLFDYIRGDRHITPGHVPEGENFKEVLTKNDKYYEEGFICKQEKEILLDMIDEIENHIYQKNSKEEENMGLFDKFNKKYNVNPEDNMPQIVYGPPAEFITKETDIKFEFYEGGYFGPCECYHVEKMGDKYKFKAGYSAAGRPNLNDDKSLDIVIKGEEDYTKFIKELKDMISNWEEHYRNSSVMDGTQWHLKIEELNVDCGGSNAFPQNYKKVKKFITKNFKCKFNIDNYEIDPEDNVPREVYGIPSPVQKDLDKEKDKYEVNPEKNVPQRVYGVPNPEKFELDLDKRNKESVSVIINDYCLSLTKWGNTCDLLFMNKTKESFIKDSIVSVSLEKFDKFVSRIDAIASEWKNEYSGIKNIKWQVKFNTKQLNKTIVGNGEYPLNWNQFVDLISEYEVLFKKTIIYNNKDKNVDLNASFEEIVKAKVNDPFWEKVICDYLKQEINKSDTVLKIIFKDLIKYDDIFDEFTKYLVQKTYDIPGAISVEGYTAKKISELNPSFKATGVYTFLNYLREKPEEAKDVIKKGFPNKDAILPTKNKESYLKLIHTPFHGCYGTQEELDAQKVVPIISYYKIERGQSILLDRINVIIDDLTNEIVSLSIPYQTGIVVNQDDYRKQQSSKVMLKKGEKCTLQLDVYDAMESWEISFVDKKENDENNSNNAIKKLDFEKTKIVINETYIDENGHEVDKERVVELGGNVIFPQKTSIKDNSDNN